MAISFSEYIVSKSLFAENNFLITHIIAMSGQSTNRSLHVCYLSAIPVPNLSINPSFEIPYQTLQCFTP